MTRIHQSLLWGTAIIGATLAASSNGLGDAATFGIIAGLSGAAIGSIYGRRSSCGRSTS